MTRPRVLLATRNGKKLAELRRILSDSVDITLIGIELVGIDDVPASDEPAETGETFAENALIKARAGAAHTGLVAVADDSGLSVRALGGMPGVLSARWAGRDRDDAANLDLVLDQLADVPEGRREAAFLCAAAVVSPDGTEHVVEGRMPGRIIHVPRGTGGFGYDPVFIADGQRRTNAELAPDEKDAISHRGSAFRALVPTLALVVGRVGHRDSDETGPNTA